MRFYGERNHITRCGRLFTRLKKCICVVNFIFWFRSALVSLFHWLEPRINQTWSEIGYFFHWFNYRMAATFFKRLSINCSIDARQFSLFKMIFLSIFIGIGELVWLAPSQTITLIYNWIDFAKPFRLRAI